MTVESLAVDESVVAVDVVPVEDSAVVVADHNDDETVVVDDDIVEFLSYSKEYY